MHFALRQSPQLRQRQQLRHSLEQRQTLSLSQTLATKQLFALRQELRSPMPVDATRGMEGLRVSDEILKRQNAVGILIGGLAEEVFKAKTVDELESHKDVDVLISSEKPFTPEQFEGGIDWWCPETENIYVRTPESRFDGKSTCWRNGNGVVLGFGVQAKRPHEVQNMSPGLYIGNKDFVSSVREAEAVTLSTCTDELSYYGALTKLSKSFKKTLPRRSVIEDVKKSLKGQILSNMDLFQVSPFERAVYEEHRRY